MYAIMKLEYEAPIYDDFGFGTLKGGILKKIRLGYSRKKTNRGMGGCRGQNPRSLEIPHDFFLVTFGNSTSVLINP